MNNLKRKIFTGLGLAIAIILMVGTFIYFENYEAVYYTQVDNTRAEKASISSDMKYIYRVDCYSETGKKKEYTFKTYKELKEGAYLKLEIRSSGVHAWMEIDQEELPKKVKEKYE